jgi:hypothetical protein
MSIGMQNYLFTIAAANLTSKLRSLSFKAILRQDSELSILLPSDMLSTCVVEFFDKEENNVCCFPVCISVSMQWTEMLNSDWKVDIEVER